MITRENNESIWAVLKAQWQKEGKPSYLARGGKTYRVIQHSETKEIAFKPVSRESLMGSLSV